MLIKAYIIHLQKVAARRKNVERLKDRLSMPSVIIPAIDAQSLPPETLKLHVLRYIHVPRYPFPLSQAEAACFLSHRAAWEAIVDDGVDAGLVLEDDAMITPDFDGAFELARSTATPGSFIRFPYRDGREAGLTLRQEGRYRVLVPSPVGLGMVAQLVTREAALRLLSRTAQFDRPVDTFVQMHWVAGVRPLSIQPGGVCEISRDLGGSTVSRKKSLLAKIRHEVLRPIYRKKIQLLSFQ